jgi:hypothetical protein
METEENPAEESQKSPEDATGALDADNPAPSEDAGQKGAGAATGGDEGLDQGSEPAGEDARDAERP